MSSNEVCLLRPILIDPINASSVNDKAFNKWDEAITPPIDELVDPLDSTIDLNLDIIIEIYLISKI